MWTLGVGLGRDLRAIATAFGVVAAAAVDVLPAAEGGVVGMKR